MSRWASAGRRGLVVGHRGARGPGCPPENTIEAFAFARSLGAKAIELDARMGRDGQAVVFHDPTLARMTAGEDVRSVDEVPVAELKAIDLGGGARVPALVDVLSWSVKADVSVNVELKHDGGSPLRLARSSAAAARDTGADVLYSSFDPRLLLAAAAYAPRARRALLTHARQPEWANILMRLSRPPLAFALHLEESQVTSSLLSWCARAKVRVGVWTCNDGAAARSLVARGVAFVITDVPGVIVEALAGA